MRAYLLKRGIYQPAAAEPAPVIGILLKQFCKPPEGLHTTFLMEVLVRFLVHMQLKVWAESIFFQHEKINGFKKLARPGCQDLPFPYCTPGLGKFSTNGYEPESKDCEILLPDIQLEAEGCRVS